MISPQPEGSFCGNIEGVLVGQRGDVLGPADGSHLANSTGDQSIQNVASNPEMLRTTPTNVHRQVGNSLNN